MSEAGLLDNTEAVDAAVKQALSSVMEKASVHFGQPYLNTATMAGLYRMMLKEMAASYGVTFPGEKE